jgi:hypothetical protein
MNNKKILNILIFLIPFLLLISCSQNKSSSKADDGAVLNDKLTNLNISLLLDLSDRIDPEINPNQAKRDQEAILSVVEYFKNHVKNKSALTLKDKMRVIFHPPPESDNIPELVESLSVNFEEKDINKEKIFNELTPTYKNNIPDIFEVATSREKYEGSDIWHFMKDDVRRRCIISDPNHNIKYRNILVILTDGYMYWPYDKRNEGNRYNHITGGYEHFNQFRNPNTNLLNTKFEEEDYGFISVQDSLQNLEILVLGISTSKDHQEDLDIIKKYWSKWFDEMNVKKYEILKTGFPSTTEDAINNFLNN